MASKNIGTLSVDLRLQSQKFTEGMKRAHAGMERMRASARRMTGAFNRMGGSIAAVAGVAGMGMLIKKSLESGDALAKMSDRIGISTENLAGFQQLAQLSGESIEGFDKSIEKMVRSIGEAARGTGTGKRAFEELGISLDDLKGKNADEQFLIIGDAIKGVRDKTLQASYASDIFGRSGVKMLNTISAGREGFEKAKAEAEKFGLAISRVDAAKIEMANDAIHNAGQTIRGAALSATADLSPLIETVAKRFTQAGTEGEGFGGTIRKVITASTKAVGVFADGIHGIKVIIKGVETALKGFGSVWANTMNFIVNDVIIPAANKAKQFLMEPIKGILEFAAKYSDTAANMLNSMNESSIGRVKWLDDFAKKASDSFDKAKIDLQTKMMETIPSERMKALLDEVFTEADKRAQEIADKQKKIAEETKKAVTGKTGNDENSDDEEDPEKKKSMLDRLAEIEITNSKKVARIKQAIRLKEAIATKGKAILEAVSSGSFPGNLPAIAFATVEAAAAISQIKNAGSFMGGGHTGSGARVGGTDGWGGMAATVHPNETVVDHTKGQGMGSTSINYTQNISGISEDAIYDAMRRNERRFGRMVQQWQAKPI